MKSIDLPVGAHVAYDQNESRNYHSFIEAFVMTHRPRGNRSSYWGSKNNNHDTVGIAYSTNWNKDKDGKPIWRSLWVRPQTLHMLWDEHLKAVALDKARSEEYARIREQEKAANKARLDKIPQAVLKALNIKDYTYDSLVERNSHNMYITIEKIEAVIKAARTTDPATMQYRIQSEVESALALLSG